MCNVLYAKIKYFVDKIFICTELQNIVLKYKL